MNIDEIRAKNDHELGTELEKMKRELFDLRFKSATQPLSSPARIRQLRREIARVNTILGERRLHVRGAQPR
jgi:large subunit ribosomal protein L29